MANQPILPTLQSITSTVIPVDHTPVLKPKPIVPPAGSEAAGGPTQGQLFPVGNR